ncbi:putative WD repeat-containing protein F47D12.9 [Ditylenchus destructor]|nr:putative WD repeat-containing protein F47D12.9 [Ditylenchus destructor]
MPLNKQESHGPSSSNYRHPQNNHRGNYRARHQSWVNRRRQDSTSSQPAIRSEEISDLPGYAYDAVTKKYFKILPNTPGQPSGSTQRDLNVMNQRHRANLRAQNKKETSISRIVPNLLRNIQIVGNRCAFPALPSIRLLERERIRNASNTPSYDFEVADNMSDRFAGCQFLDVKEDGKALIGCWGTTGSFLSQYSCPSCSRVVSYKVSVDPVAAERASRNRDSDQPVLDTNGRYSCNTFGLRFESVDNCIDVDSTLVDMAIAPADSDVTVILYATANSFISASQKIVTCCNIFLRAVDQLTKEEGKTAMESPIYNATWEEFEPIWSCAFNANKMRVGVGMENCASIFDVLTENKFKVSSGGRSVIAQEYSMDGDILFLGRRGANMALLDLRLSHQHTVAEFLDSNSSCFIRQMEGRSNYLKLWDSRTRRCVMDFSGHRNSSHKLPCFVDANENFVFAVGEDTITRGWSLSTGELLCSIDCPQSLQDSSDFPQVVYSPSWGGVNGNAAIILAAKRDPSILSVHELLL